MSVPTTKPWMQSQPARLSLAIYGSLFSLAALGWWWVVRMGGAGMSASGMRSMTDSPSAMSFSAFLVAWIAMMAAMMLPSVSPVVALFRRAAATRRVAPTPIFLLGYLVVWSAPGLAVYFAWRSLLRPLGAGAHWAAWLAGAALVAAAVWQLTPAKSSCLGFCRSPLTFFLRFGKSLDSWRGTFRAGLLHGGFCFGCCWALMAVLVAVGSMNLEWMAGLAALIFLEKIISANNHVVRAAAVALAGIGIALIAYPAMIVSLT